MAGIEWQESEINLLKELVPTGKYSYRQLEKFLPGRRMAGITSKAHSLGLSNPYVGSLYSFDRSSFKNPNYMNCFFMGWVAADGSFSFRGPNNEHCDFRWEMHSADEYFLHLFKKYTKYNGPIKTFSDKSEKSGRIAQHSIIKINSLKSAYDDIYKNFGLTEKKTFRLSPPNLLDIEYKLAYIVGYINGDGCIHAAKSGFVINFTSASMNILEWIKNLITELNLPERRKTFYRVKKIKGTNCYLLSIGGIRAIYLFELLKLVPVPVLLRKWENPAVLKWIENKKSEYPNWFVETIDSVMDRNNINFSKFSKIVL